MQYECNNSDIRPQERGGRQLPYIKDGGAYCIFEGLRGDFGTS